MNPQTKRTDHSALSSRYHYLGRNLLSGLLFGVGLVAFIDEMIFHQLLHWHHFYDKSTKDVGLISDGFFHAFSWFSTIGGLFLFADLRRRGALWVTRWMGGVLLGAGGFQLYDGTIQHKLMRIHQIRYVDSVYIYDWVWNILATILVLLGTWIVIQTKRKERSMKAASHDKF
ncbi:DUF2243 domain-containing protein [Fictibacillus phosphorivorans]|uniref:DUF2243 domain-containing protein n=1 Tax=Fictibacillus phosphorivorans TaxID=1221500 RepID=UPI00203AD035|nr:DUF2243 domain-containing protein [Fictibacillus phosphorivorans]MCM3719487.1 DUF2243 domain-containing protein [Fictibacillus phosphorivorans]MCM3777178.1 DUF2243 domain-containing protein [Fictibacillus phosphorivorans]